MEKKYRIYASYFNREISFTMTSTSDIEEVVTESEVSIRKALRIPESATIYAAHYLQSFSLSIEELEE